MKKTIQITLDEALAFIGKHREGLDGWTFNHIISVVYDLNKHFAKNELNADSTIKIKEDDENEDEYI